MPPWRSPRRKPPGGRKKLAVEFSAKGAIPFSGQLAALEAAASAGRTNPRLSESTWKSIQPIRTFIRVLGAMGFGRFIVLEDFHYLSEEVQRQVAMDLKAFHEKSKLSFVVVGVWLESNRLVLYNGDLADVSYQSTRIAGNETISKASSPVGRHCLTSTSRSQFGMPCSTLLRATLGFCRKPATACVNPNRFCETRQTCRCGNYRSGRRNRAGACARTGRSLSELPHSVRRGILEERVGDVQMADVRCCWPAADLRMGLRSFEIFTRMQRVHPYRERLLYNNTLQALRNVGKLQHQKKVQPVILDFDSNENVLRIVDSGFTLFLDAQYRQGLKEFIGLGELPPRAPDRPTVAEQGTITEEPTE